MCEWINEQLEDEIDKVRVEEIDGIEAFPATLGVEVQATGGEATHVQYALHDSSTKHWIGREAVGVPSTCPIAHVASAALAPSL